MSSLNKKPCVERSTILCSLSCIFLCECLAIYFCYALMYKQVLVFSTTKNVVDSRVVRISQKDVYRIKRIRNDCLYKNAIFFNDLL
jgi:hypothetical protein